MYGAVAKSGPLVFNFGTLATDYRYGPPSSPPRCADGFQVQRLLAGEQFQLSTHGEGPESTIVT